jgi:TonB family protein
VKRIVLVALLIVGSITAKAQLGVYTGSKLQTGIDNNLPDGRVFVDAQGHGHINELTLRYLEINTLAAIEANGGDPPSNCTMWNQCRPLAFAELYDNPIMAQRGIDLAPPPQKEPAHTSVRPPDYNGFVDTSKGAHEASQGRPSVKVAPSLIFESKIKYSFGDKLKYAQFRGTALVTITIDEQGNVSDAKIRGSLGNSLDKNVLEAVKRYVFAPETIDGNPKATVANVNVTVCPACR